MSITSANADIANLGHGMLMLHEKLAELKEDRYRRRRHKSPAQSTGSSGSTKPKGKDTKDKEKNAAGSPLRESRDPRMDHKAVDALIAASREPSRERTVEEVTTADDEVDEELVSLEPAKLTTS